MKPAGIIPTRIGYTRYSPGISRPTPNKPPRQSDTLTETELADAVENQGREHRDVFVLAGVCVGVVLEAIWNHPIGTLCGVVGGLVLAGVLKLNGVW